MSKGVTRVIHKNPFLNTVFSGHWPVQAVMPKIPLNLRELRPEINIEHFNGVTTVIHRKTILTKALPSFPWLCKVLF